MLLRNAVEIVKELEGGATKHSKPEADVILHLIYDWPSKINTKQNERSD